MCRGRATAAEISGATLPDNAGEDSFSLLATLCGKEAQPAREAVVHQSGGGNLSIRQGQWKLIQAGGARPSYADASKTAEANKAKPAKPGPFLVNLADDLNETKNLAEDNPAKVAELRALMEKLRADGRSRP